MRRDPGQLRTIAFAMVVMGFLAELVGVVMLGTGRRTPAALAIMTAGLFLVIMAIILLNSSRP